MCSFRNQMDNCRVRRPRHRRPGHNLLRATSPGHSIVVSAARRLSGRTMWALSASSGRHPHPILRTLRVGWWARQTIEKGTFVACITVSVTIRVWLNTMDSVTLGNCRMHHNTVSITTSVSASSFGHRSQTSPYPSPSASRFCLSL